ncbi:MAG: glycosyltransferase [Patescibacteria group bacterium]|jgi:glycosyltransferase involved in cell wall biosynthesis
MRIAIFHNYLDNIGGAEIVTLTLAQELNADIYTTNIRPSSIKAMGFAEVLPRIKSLGRIPKMAPFRQQLAFWKFRRLKLSGQYDFFIIAGDWAMSGAVNNHPNLWYAHSPLNELWEFKDFIKKNVLSRWKISPYDKWVAFNRRLTLKYAKHVDIWICNSQNTQNRIKKYYNQVAEIIYPPIKANHYPKLETNNYWLSVNRLITHKRIDLQLKAFSSLPKEKLIIVGSYEPGVKQFEGYKAYLEKIKPPNVEIIHWADSQKLAELYAGCKGFITTAENEDFGMTVLEAMAAGKPVIAPNEGGYQESVTKKTGVLITEITPEKLAIEIQKMTDDLNIQPLKYQANCLARAQEFGVEVFIDKIRKAINNFKSL